MKSDIMISLEEISLFSNVPLDLAKMVSAGDGLIFNVTRIFLKMTSISY